jgi:NADPH:quinone reductase
VKPFPHHHPSQKGSPMAQAIRMHETGNPSVLRLEEVPVGNPGVGEVRLRHVAVGLNYADTYFRNGTYPIALPSGLGVEAAGVVEQVGPGVSHVQVGDRVSYTGFLNTLGAYCTERVMAAAPLIPLPAGIACETAAAMTMRGLTAAYLMRRIYPFKAGDTVLLHAAAGGVGLIGIHRRKSSHCRRPRLRPHHQLQP